MTDFLELLSFRKDRDGKWKPVRIEGWAKKNDKGGLGVCMYTMPMAENGQVRFVIQKRQERNQGGKADYQAPTHRPSQEGATQASGGFYDDDVGF